jgi:hypothetical protein
MRCAGDIRPQGNDIVLLELRAAGASMGAGIPTVAWTFETLD